MHSFEPPTYTSVIVAACTAHLCLGIALGLLLGRRASWFGLPIESLGGHQPAQRALSDTANKWESHAISTSELSKRLVGLGAVCRKQPTLMPAPIMHEIESITKDAKRLHQELLSTAGSCKKWSEPPAKANKESHLAGETRHENAVRTQSPGMQRPGHSQPEKSLLSEVLALEELEESRPNRHRYAAIQMLAPRDSEEHPPASEFREVECNDVGAGGVSFFLDKDPDFESFIITIGTQPNVEFLCGRVIDSRPVSAEGATRYLVDGQFLQRVNAGIYRWDAHASRVAMSTPLDQAAGSPPRILLADDSPVDREIVQFGLAHVGFDVTTAEDGQEAWEVLQREQFDLVITDEIMPWMTGQQLCEKMHAHETLSRVPVVMLTSLSEDVDRASMRSLGVAAVLSKPFDPPQAIKLIDSLIGSNAANRKTARLAIP